MSDTTKVQIEEYNRDSEGAVTIKNLSVEGDEADVIGILQAMLVGHGPLLLPGPVSS